MERRRVGRLSMVEIPPDRPLRLRSAAAACFDPDSGVTDRTLQGAIRSGALTGYRIRGKLFTTPADIQAWLQRCRVQGSLSSCPPAPNIAPPATEASAAVARAHHAIEQLMAPDNV
jgi:hypothetical protein